MENEQQNQPMHLFIKHGILEKFNIVKKMDSKELDEIIKSVKKSCKKHPENFDNALSDKLIETAKKYASTVKPPGLIFPNNNEDLKKMYDNLSDISKSISEDFINKKLKKHQLCFIINMLLTLLDITEDDFKEFHRKIKEDMDDGDNDALNI